LILGSILVINQEINLGQFVASEIIILLVLSSAEKLILTMETVYDVLTGLEKLGQITDVPLEDEGGISLVEVCKEGGIPVEFANLSYRFEGAYGNALHDINLDVKAGEKIGITGTNQSGKSTLLSVVSGLFHNYEGSVLFNGIPFSDINISSFRSVVGDNLNLQDLFHGTLAQNISVGKDDVAIEDILRSIELVGLNGFLKNLPNGLATMISPEGQGLSDSVRQKIILARTLAEKPKIVVMDNALNGLDFEDRKRISNILTDSSQEWTLLAVTSDPLLLNNCDRVVTLERGRIVDVSKTIMKPKKAK
ncbi:ATP-binding cassette domain-containing protein, partial [Reichenbachiella sp.]